MLYKYNDIEKAAKYDPQTGKIYVGGRERGKNYGDGYLQLSVNGYNHYAHRLAWYLYYGRKPNGYIDHVNHDRTDNRIENLREVSPRESRMNSSLRSDNKSGIQGVFWDNSRDMWHAKIKVNGRAYFLGHFDDIAEAASARLFANDHFGFHENHQ